MGNVKKKPGFLRSGSINLDVPVPAERQEKNKEPPPERNGFT